MATDTRLFVFAGATPPAKAPSEHPGAFPIPVLSAKTLRRQTETAAGRALTWEEWYDVRTAWAKAHNCLNVDIARGDEKGLALAAQQAIRSGRAYLLLEIVS